MAARCTKHPLCAGAQGSIDVVLPCKRLIPQLKPVTLSHDNDFTSYLSFCTLLLWNHNIKTLEFGWSL